MTKLTQNNRLEKLVAKSRGRHTIVEAPKKQVDVKKILLRNITERNGCWEWKRAVSVYGYGNLRYEGKNWRAHRLSYTVFKGPIEKDLLVCHKCDNPRCINPDHLFLGTHKQNMQDCVQKGRFRNAPKKIAVPETNATAKIAYQFFLKKNTCVHLLSMKYNVPVEQVQKIREGMEYAYLIKPFIIIPFKAPS